MIRGLQYFTLNHESLPYFIYNNEQRYDLGNAYEKRGESIEL